MNKIKIVSESSTALLEARINSLLSEGWEWGPSNGIVGHVVNGIEQLVTVVTQVIKEEPITKSIEKLEDDILGAEQE